jgi:hypothetical protein
MADVYYSEHLDEGFLSQLRLDLEKYFSGCKRIAVKMHFGEPGNSYAFMPDDIRPITALLEGLGLEYFLYDSSVAYGGARSDPKTYKEYAVSKGFSNVDTGDEFMIVNGVHQPYQVCSKLADADAVLVLTHLKGHECTGFGGAIKNLGMGALTKQSKSSIHKGGEPVFEGDCKKCGKCVRNCPVNGMRLDDDKKYPVIFKCFGCSNCSYVCPHGIISPKLAYFDVLLSDGANAAQSTFKRYYYVTIMKRITAHCDCYDKPGEIIAKDAGFLMSKDGVAIDKAAYDIIQKNDKDAFLKINFKKGTEQVFAAESLGMGSSIYEFKTI